MSKQRTIKKLERRNNLYLGIVIILLCVIFLLCISVESIIQKKTIGLRKKLQTCQTQTEQPLIKIYRTLDGVSHTTTYWQGNNSFTIDIPFRCGNIFYGDYDSYLENCKFLDEDITWKMKCWDNNLPELRGSFEYYGDLPIREEEAMTSYLNLLYDNCEVLK